MRDREIIKSPFDAPDEPRKDRLQIEVEKAIELTDMEYLVHFFPVWFHRIKHKPIMEKLIFKLREISGEKKSYLKAISHLERRVRGLSFYKDDVDKLEKKIIALEDRNKELSNALHEVAWDVFFNPYNQYPNNDVIWHSKCCTAFENICPYLDVDFSDGNQDEDLKRMRETIIKKGLLHEF